MHFNLAQLPQDAVLEGVSLTEQHRIDHEFLIQGSPLAWTTPVPLVLVSLGILLTVAGILAVNFRTASASAAVAALAPAPFLLAAKHIWMVVDVSSKYDYPGVASYVLRYYSEYWRSETIALVVFAVLAIINLGIALVRGRRAPQARQ